MVTAIDTVRVIKMPPSKIHASVTTTATITDKISLLNMIYTLSGVTLLNASPDTALTTTENSPTANVLILPSVPRKATIGELIAITAYKNPLTFAFNILSFTPK